METAQAPQRGGQKSVDTESWLDAEWRDLRLSYSAAGPPPFSRERVRQDMINLALSGRKENVAFARGVLGAEWAETVTEGLLTCAGAGDLITADILLQLLHGGEKDAARPPSLGSIPDCLWGAIASGPAVDTYKAAFVRELRAGAPLAPAAPGALARAAKAARIRGDALTAAALEEGAACPQ